MQDSILAQKSHRHRFGRTRTQHCGEHVGAGRTAESSENPRRRQLHTPEDDLSGADSGSVVVLCDRTNPGGHGIFDFISRDPETYLPDVALTRFEKPKNIFSQPQAVNRRGGVPLWQVLTEVGVPSTVLRCPCTFPPESLNGKMLAGVGVPDLRGSQSK